MISSLDRKLIMTIKGPRGEMHLNMVESEIVHYQEFIVDIQVQAIKEFMEFNNGK
jgi:hypothetical protein